MGKYITADVCGFVFFSLLFVFVTLMFTDTVYSVEREPYPATVVSQFNEPGNRYQKYRLNVSAEGDHHTVNANSHQFYMLKPGDEVTVVKVQSCILGNERYRKVQVTP